MTHVTDDAEARVRVALWVATMMLATVNVVHGHPMSHSLSRLAVEGPDVRVTLTIDLLELQGIDRNADARIDFEELDASIERVYPLLRNHFAVDAGRAPTGVSLEHYAVIEDGHIGRFVVLYRFAAPPGPLTVRSTLHQVTTPEHRHLTSVTRDGVVQEGLLEAARPAVTLDVVRRSRIATMWSFMMLGVEHIATGYDHLAFLVCLVIGARSVRAVVLVVTSFTIAHSITLALATFDLVALPPRLIESLIALSIAYVAVENLMGQEAVARYKVTFLFGLVHGFGFSNILRDMQLPRTNLAASLFSFNAGVEIGQIVFVLVLFPLAAWLQARRTPLPRAAVSLTVFGLAVFWFIERALPR